MLKVLVKDGDFDYIFVASCGSEVEDKVREVFNKALWEMDWKLIEGSSIEDMLKAVYHCGKNHIYINCKDSARKYLSKFPNYLKKDLALEQELKRIWNLGFKNEPCEIYLIDLM